MKKLFYIFYILFFPFTISVNAQWATDYNVNTLVSSSTSADSKSLSTTDGKTYVVYWVVKPAPVNYELHAQLIDKNGSKLFGDDGVVVSQNAISATYISIYSITRDKDNNLFVGFTSTGETSSGYIQKISPTGELLWGVNGINLGTLKYDVKMFPSDHSGVYLSYYDGTYGYIQNLNTQDGSFQWQNTVKVSPPNANYPYTSVGEGAVLSDDSFVALIHGRQTSDVFSSFFAQRYTTDGNPVWSNMLKLSNRNTYFNTRYNIILEDDVIYLGYYGSSTTRFDSYLQRLNPDGTIPWGINGSDFSTTNAYYEMNTSIATTEGSQYIWSVSRYTTTSQGDNGEYIQKFNKNTGERLLTDGAKELFPVDGTGKVHAANIQMMKGKIIVPLREANNSGVEPTNLSVAILDDNGDFVLDNKYKDIATTNTYKSRVNFTSNDNQAVEVWEENRTGLESDNKTYIQNFSIDDNSSIYDNSKKSDIYIYPNPVSSILNIVTDADIKACEILDASGKNIKTFHSEKINLGNLPSGLYFLKVYISNGEVSVHKIVKK